MHRSLSVSCLAFSRFALYASAVLGGVSLVGCGSNGSLPVANEPTASLQGTFHGGANPVIGATVNYYATTSGGTFAGGVYTPAAPVLVQTGTTGASGSFNLAAPAGVTPTPVCATGQQGYVVAYGGNAGAGNNANYVAMAALGPCANVANITSVFLSEATTVAAAYALRPFTSISTDGNANPLVAIGAPANNNAAAGNCTTVSNATTGCVAAGLPHAIANALNLANAISTTATNPNGQSYAVTPSNPNGQVPQALLNSLANSMEACVNSTGGSATGGAGGTSDGTTCGTFFAAATPPVTGAVAPTNTLQALLNIAQYPTNNVAAIYTVATPTSYFTPTLTTQPTDYSVAVAYSGVTLSSLSGSVTGVTLTNTNASGFGSGDAYTTVPTVTFSAPTSGTTATGTASLGVVFFNATGGTGCTPGTQPVTITNGGGSGAVVTAVIGANGAATSGSVTNPGSGYTGSPTFVVTTCTTQPTKTKGLGVVAVAVTNSGSGYTAAPTVTFSAPLTSTAPPNVTATATSTIGGAVPFSAPYALTLDANDDVFVGSQNVLGTAGQYSFVSSIGANGASIFTTAQTTSLTAPRGAGTDTLGHVWFAQNNTPMIQGLNSTSGAAFSTLTTGAAPFGLGIDKANNVWYGIASTTAQNLFELQQAAAAPYTAVTFTAPPTFSSAVRTIAFDANQNAYVSGFSATANTAGSYPNAGTAAAPAYTATAINAALTGGASGAGIALDAASNVWAPVTTGLFKVVPTFGGTNGTQVTALTPGTALTDNVATPNYNSVDGSGSVWVPNNGTGTQNIAQYVPGTGAAPVYTLCYLATGATTCTAGLSQPQRTEVDSTGSVWITSLTNGRVYQLIGTGSPTWPQLSLGAPGVMPQ